MDQKAFFSRSAEDRARQNALDVSLAGGAAVAHGNVLGRYIQTASLADIDRLERQIAALQAQVAELLARDKP